MCFQVKQESGIHVLQIGVSLPLKEGKIKKIKRGLKKYQLNHNVIGADNEMAAQLEIEELLFQARKRELLQNKEKILCQMKNMGAQEGRNSVLFVLNSRKWSHKDILSMLLTAKDYYEDINIVLEWDYIGIEQFVETMYEEWGVVLHVVQREEVFMSKFNLVLFLLEKWEKQVIEQYEFRGAYMVLDMEDVRLKRKYTEEWGEKERGGLKKKSLYSGLAYEKEQKKIPYQMAVNIACQNPILYSEFSLSAVAIYRLEW